MAEYIDRAVCLSILRAKANMAVLMDAAPYFEKAAQMLEKLPSADVAPVVHGRWKYYHKQNKAVCTHCSFERDLDENFGAAISCPNCGAKMDGGDGDAAD